MNILYIITQADGGGAQKYTLALAKHFGGTIAAGNEASKLFEDAKAAGLQTFELKHLQREINPWKDFLAIWEIRRLIQELKPDIVHLNSTKAGILGSFASVGLKTKVVFTAHGFRFNEPLSFASRQFYLALEKVASSYRDFIITVSAADEKSALANFIIKPQKIRTIHNGLSPVNFLAKADARAELHLPQDTKIICAIANDYTTKGVSVLEQASSLMSRDSNSLTVVYGNIPFGKKVNSEGKFQRRGFKLNVSSYLKAFDILAIPSLKEGLPFALLEGMRAGLPIVATDVGGNREAVGDAGILIEPGNPAALAGALDSIISNPILARELGQRAEKRSNLFSEEKMLEQTKKVYEDLF